MSDPSVSVVVPTRGGASRLPALLGALSHQDLVDWEAIIVVDGDIDGSSDIVDLVGDRRVRRVTFETNHGRSAALNAGFNEARGRVLVRCDDDLVPRADYLSRHVAHHAEHEVGVIGLYRNVYPETHYARVYGRGWDQRFRQEAYAAPSDEAWRYWAGNVSVTRDTWHRVGPYDTAFRAYGWEDVDWGYRLRLSGTPIVLDPDLETEHRIAATTTAMRLHRAYYSGAARSRFEQKHATSIGSTVPASTWERFVATLACGLDERRAERLGALIDTSSRVLPDRAANKAVALAIDAAARAGHQRGSTAGAI